jgi:hypothetical protein
MYRVSTGGNIFYKSQLQITTIYLQCDIAKYINLTLDFTLDSILGNACGYVQLPDNPPLKAVQHYYAILKLIFG